MGCGRSCRHRLRSCIRAAIPTRRPRCRVSVTTALVVEGGAMRGIFAAGVLDSFLDKDFCPFDLCIGVSAGANNLAAFLAGMRGRNYSIYTDYSLRPEFINTMRFLRGGHLMDLDWLWEITIRELPLDTAHVDAAPQEYCVGVTRVRDGKVVYARPEGDNLAQILKASSAMPLVYRSVVKLPGVRIEDAGSTVLGDSETYVDGGLAEPIPVREALRRGARTVVVIRSRPMSYTMDTGKKHRLMRFSLRRHPALQQRLAERAERYNQTLAYMRSPDRVAEGVQIIEVAPPESFESSRTTRDIDALNRDYERGLQAGIQAVQDWK
ncbi:MAG: patatin family protein [Spirochaetaceae bacterium]|nr:MAG: patatin family protein [Spirochaetaceae bacterium]